MKGNTSAVSSALYEINPDTTPPVVTPGVGGTLGTNGWYTSDVTVSWTATDPESSITSPPCSPTNVTADTAGVTLSCSATSSGGTTTESVTVKRDATAPTIAAHGPESAEATGPGGAVVAYNPPAASDNFSPDGVAGCAPQSGATFPLGSTTVDCDAVDAAGNPAVQTHFTVTVVDTTGPTFTAPANMTVAATSPVGAVVTYTTPTATDAVDGTVAVHCLPASTTTFPIATTTVTCTATDAHTNTTMQTFTVTVSNLPANAGEQVGPDRADGTRGVRPGHRQEDRRRPHPSHEERQ